MYDKQLNMMLNYLFILEDRAVIEGIDLDSLVEGVNNGNICNSIYFNAKRT